MFLILLCEWKRFSLLIICYTCVLRLFSQPTECSRLWLSYSLYMRFCCTFLFLHLLFNCNTFYIIAVPCFYSASGSSASGSSSDPVSPVGGVEGFEEDELLPEFCDVVVPLALWFRTSRLKCVTSVFT